MTQTEQFHSTNLFIWLNNNMMNMQKYLQLSSSLIFNLSCKSLIKIYLSRWNENLCAHKYLYVNVYSGFICKCWKLEFIHLSLSWRMDQLRYIHTMKCYLTIKREQTADTQNRWISTIHLTLSVREARLKRLWMYNSVHMPCSRQGNTIETENRLVVGGARDWPLRDTKTWFKVVETYPDYGNSYVTMSVCQDSQNCALERVNFTVYKLYLNTKMGVI